MNIDYKVHTGARTRVCRFMLVKINKLINCIFAIETQNK